MKGYQKLDSDLAAKVEAYADKLAEEPNFVAAAIFLLKVAHSDPDETSRWVRAARWYCLGEKTDKAITTLPEAIKYNLGRSKTKSPPSVRDEALITLYLALLEIQVELQDWEACIPTCTHFLELSPRHHFALEILATAQLHTSRIEESTATMRILLQLSPNDPLHRMKYATLLQIQGITGEAATEFSRVASAFPGAPFAGDARDAIELLDGIQIQEVLMRLANDTFFRLQLQRSFDDTLQENGFRLSETGRESLRQMVEDGRPDLRQAPLRVH